MTPANRRILLPEGFLAADEMLHTVRGIVEGLQINQAAIRRNLETYGPFAATERVLMAAVRAGASRQEMHERIRAHSICRPGRRFAVANPTRWPTCWRKTRNSCASSPPNGCAG